MLSMLQFMCTVTYIPVHGAQGGFFVTDNRDESVNRPADPPRCYAEYGTHLFYPRDISGGGTWMGCSCKKRLICLMNGAFTKYYRQPPYRKSRGIVVKELLAADRLELAVDCYDFAGIEPFFALVFDWLYGRQIWELVWDGSRIHLRTKDGSRPEIWSSAMSYTKEEHRLKKDRFQEFLSHHRANITPDLLWQFHHLKERDTPGGMIIRRGLLSTTSITQFRMEEGKRSIFRFHDLLSGREQQAEVYCS